MPSVDFLPFKYQFPCFELLKRLTLFLSSCTKPRLWWLTLIRKQYISIFSFIFVIILNALYKLFFFIILNTSSILYMILYQIIYLKEILKEMSKDSFYFHLFLTDFEIQNLKQRFRVLVKDQIIFLHKLSFELYIKKKAVKYLNITYDSISHIYLWFWFDGILLD